MKGPINEFEDTFWGAPSKVVSRSAEFRVSDDSRFFPDSLLKNAMLTPMKYPRPSEVNTVINDLVKLAKGIEDTIKELNTQPGQSMALNKLSFIKQDVLLAVKTLKST